MDLQKQSAKGYDSYSSYQKYADVSPNEAERILERDAAQQEFQVDKDAIVLALKNALREHNYEEAKAFVDKYRDAAGIDEDFAALAKMTEMGLEQQKKIHKIETMLDATGENDYEARIAFCNKILKIQPDNEKYLQELNRCREAKGLAPVAANGMASPVPVKVSNGIKTGVALYFAFVMMFLELIVCMVQAIAFQNWIGVAVLLTAACIHACSLIPKHFRLQPVSKLAVRLGINFALFIFALLFGVLSFML